MEEFSIIENFFDTQKLKRKDVCLGIGDDAALIKIPEGNELAITTDTLVAGVHFLKTAAAYDVGYKSLAVNLSDLAAMGAQPAWATLALTMPSSDINWIKKFSEGFFALAERFEIQLIGGDTTQGPLSITIQAMGLVPEKQAILRSGAKAKDLIYVTGTFGDAAYALQAILKQKPLPAALEERLLRPEPRVAVGEKLRGIASAAVDVSDGLAADLKHILDKSAVGANVDVDKIPLSQTLVETFSKGKSLALALTGGDDFELCFTIPPEKQPEMEKLLANIPCSVTQIGVITREPGLNLHYQDGSKYHGPISGYEHFKIY